MDIFINGSAAISPQNTLGETSFLRDAISYKGVRQLKCVEPSYSGMIDPMAARRMSRIIKMGIASALTCLKNAGVSVPDAIVTGTGLGCLEDTVKFLSSIYDNGEKLLNPTPFIQSTHNTAASAIAQVLKCKKYNSTYCHSGTSFENALTDAIMLIREEEAVNVLVGSMDELTPALFQITGRLGLWKREPVDSLDLLSSGTRGTLPGEGAAFFLLSSRKSEQSIAKIESVKTFLRPDDVKIVEEFAGSLPGKTLLITGATGDPRADEAYTRTMEELPAGLPVASYKHLCGEYETSASFALWLAAGILKEKTVPVAMLANGTTFDEIERILILNSFRNLNYTSILISKC